MKRFQTDKNPNIWKNTRGFSLAEMLMVLIVVLLVSVVVAAGIPAALRAYRNVTDAANAQVLLSTTVTRLKDELGSASDIEVSADARTVTYTNCFGSQSEIYPAADNVGNVTVFLREYAYGNGNPYDVTEELKKAGYAHPMASEETATEKFSTTYDAIEYSDGVLVIRNIKVSREDKELATADAVTIHIISDHLAK